jgi:hypothetical protein
MKPATLAVARCLALATPAHALDYSCSPYGTGRSMGLGRGHATRVIEIDAIEAKDDDQDRASDGEHLRKPAR